MSNLRWAVAFLGWFKADQGPSFSLPKEEVDAVYSKARRQTFLSIFAGYSTYYVCRTAFSTVRAPLIDGGILSASGIGLASALMLGLYALSKFFFGFAADHCSVRKIMTLGLLLSSTVNLLLAFSGLCLDGGSTFFYILFMGLWVVEGLFLGMGPSSGVVTLSRWYPLSSRARFYSIFSVTPYLGELLSFVALGASVKYLGWQYAFMISGVAGVAVSVFMLRYFKDSPRSLGLPTVSEYYAEKTTPLTASAQILEAQKGMLRSAPILIIAISTAFLYIARHGVTDWGMLFLQKARGADILEASTIIGAQAFLALAGTLASGFLCDVVFRGRRMAPAVISGMLSLIALSLFLYCRGSYLVMTLSLSLFSFFLAVTTTIVSGIMTLDLVPREVSGAANGFIGLVSYLATALGSLLSGILIDFDPSFHLPALLWIGATLVAIMLPAIVFGRKVR